MSAKRDHTVIEVSWYGYSKSNMTAKEFGQPPSTPLTAHREFWFEADLDGAPKVGMCGDHHEPQSGMLHFILHCTLFAFTLQFSFHL